MALHAYNDKLLIHLFQDSLTETTLSWYMYLKKDHIHSWKDHKQYKYNIDFTPNRMKMQNMAKGDDWIFKEYAQPRREITSQIKPPYSEKELATVFVDTLEYPFYEKMVRIS